METYVNIELVFVVKESSFNVYPWVSVPLSSQQLFNEIFTESWDLVERCPKYLNSSEDALFADPRLVTALNDGVVLQSYLHHTPSKINFPESPVTCSCDRDLH